MSEFKKYRERDTLKATQHNADFFFNDESSWIILETFLMILFKYGMSAKVWRQSSEQQSIYDNELLQDLGPLT